MFLNLRTVVWVCMCCTGSIRLGPHTIRSLTGHWKNGGIFWLCLTMVYNGVYRISPHGNRIWWYPISDKPLSTKCCKLAVAQRCIQHICLLIERRVVKHFTIIAIVMAGINTIQRTLNIHIAGVFKISNESLK